MKKSEKPAESEQSELTLAQKHIVTLATKLVEQYLHSLGKHMPLFSEKNISFDMIGPLSGEYRREANHILITTYCEAELPVIIHELVHFVSSDPQLLTPNQIYQKENEMRYTHSKSGIHSSWRRKEDSIDQDKFFFKGLNEAITEKITRDIIEKNYEFLEKEIPLLKAMFEGQKELQSKELKQHFKRKEKEATENVRATYISLIKQVLSERQDHTLQLKNLDNFAKENNLKATEIGFHREFLEEQVGIPVLKQQIARIRESMKSLAHWSNFEDILAKHTEFLEDAYTYNLKKNIVYNDEIEFLNVLLDGISQYATSHTQILSNESEWSKMQKAYLSGNTFYFRIIDKVFGKGTLRKIDHALNGQNPFGEENPEKANNEKLFTSLKERVAELKKELPYSNL